ncbi:MAG TPA: ABC transporter substrate-binding protein [Pseudonocardiaceae bacterium]
MRHRGQTWVVVVMLLVLAACGSGGAPNHHSGPGLTPVTLTLNWYPYGEHAPFYYGQLTGIFAKHGIDLTIRPGQGSGATVQAVGGDKSTFGWADTPSLLAGVSSGLPVKSVGVFLQNTPASVEFLSSANIHSPQDLKGRTIATTAGDALTAEFPTFLKSQGMTLNQVTLQNVDAAGKIAAVISGRADALLGFYHDQGPTVASKSGKPVSVLKFSDYGLDYYSTGLIVNDATIQANPTLVRDMVEATSEAFTAAVRNPAAAVQSMAGVSPQLPPTSVLTASWNDTTQLLHTTSTRGQPPGVDTDGDWQHTIDVFGNSGVLKNPGKPTDYWDPDFIQKD